ncbi:MAG: hypothetical protein U0802_13850 [Candidatus Binatia bacterium]
MLSKRGFDIAALRRALFALAALLALPAVATAQPRWTQRFNLVPGWNAIYLSVQPFDTDPAHVFEGVPVRSVWTRGTETSSVEFIGNPSDALLGQRGWVAYIPADREEAVAAALADRTLVSIQGNRAFLIHLDGAATTLEVTGVPLVPLINWQPNSFTLAGFPIDPQAAPTFAAYFAPSEAHRGQPVYRLLPSGLWERIAAPNAATMRDGEAYWVFSVSGSNYVGPLALEVPTSDGLSFGRGVSEHLLAFTNLTTSQVTVTIEDLASPAAVPLSYRKIITTPGPDVGDVQWPPLTGRLSIPTAAGSGQAARLAVRRSELAAPDVATVVAIRNGAGMRWLLPLTASGTATASAARAIGAGAVQGASAFAGLWVGGAEVRKVSEPQQGSLIPVATQGGGNVCTGGLAEGSTCAGPADCPGICTLTCAGGSRAGRACTLATQAVDCPGSTCNAQPRACAGGINSDLACSVDSDCPGSTCAAPGACAGGARVGKTCTQAADCPGSSCNTGSRCEGGVNDGKPCSAAAECAFRCDQSGAGSTFPMRLIIHVDGSGKARLLKQVIQMWQNGTTKPDPNDPNVLIDATPGRYVLLSDETLIPQFSGAALRDGVPVGKRVSTAHFDFAGNELPMQGNFGGTGSLAASIVLPPSFPTNPYRHKFHPDHDNLDAQGKPKAEAFEIERDIELDFTATDPTELGGPDFGYDAVGGVYKEELRGLHRSAIRVEGIFRLSRVALTAELNQ